jgi:multiple sugar transport system substrate-binding protein
MKSRSMLALVIVGVLLAAAGCGGGGDEGGDGGDQSITFWLSEDVAQRVEAIKAITGRFQEQSGVTVRVVAIAEDQLATQIQSASAAGTLPDVMGPLSLGFVQNLATDDLADPDAANEVIESLGRDTFSERALSLVEADGKPMGVPSDTWTQLLVYRKDLFEAAGLQTPDTLEPPRPSSSSRARTGSSPPPRPANPSPSRPSSTSRWPTAASSPTTRVPSSSARPSAWPPSSSTTT